jgi:ABC-type lipoprotein release transport system permease subunit
VNLLRMASRNLRRNRRRTGVTLAAMTLALFATVLYTSMVEGYLRSMEESIVGLEIGDLEVHATGYRDRPSLHRTIEHPELLLESLQREGFRATPRLLAGALAASASTSVGATVVGVDVASDAAATDLHRHLAGGAWLDPASPRGVVVGTRLAKSLGLAPGDELVVLGQAADGSLANDLYTVRGVLASVSDATDRAAVLMNAPAFRELFALPDGVHRIVVRRPPALGLDAAAARVSALAPGDETRTWKELLPTLASLLGSARAAMLVVFFIVYVAIAILIVNAMLMAVFERIRELGVLHALGVGPGRIVALLLLESGLLAAAATVLGTLLALPALGYVTHTGIDMGRLGGFTVSGLAIDPVWRGVITATTWSAPVLMLVAMVLLATLYPAVKAARIEPVEAMRHV